MFGWVNATLLWFVSFYKYAVSLKGLGLTQSKINPCVLFWKYEKDKSKIIVICYVDNFCNMGKHEHTDKKNKPHKEFGIVEYF